MIRSEWRHESLRGMSAHLVSYATRQCFEAGRFPTIEAVLLGRSSERRTGSNSLGLPKPKARLKYTPAPSSVGMDLIIYFTDRMRSGRSLRVFQFRSRLPLRAGRSETSRHRRNENSVPWRRCLP